MRLTYLSPSSFAMSLENREKFALRYLVDNRIPRDPQTPAMAAGSAFDAFVKHDLAGYDLKELFEKQVAEEHWSWAWDTGKRLFGIYRDQGALDVLKSLMVDPKFEVPLHGEINGVPLHGFPDCYYWRNGRLVVMDWKVVGSQGKTRPSPLKHYVIERPKGRHHKNVTPVYEDGLLVQNDHCFSKTESKWATQVSVYAWMLGVPVGEEFVAQIEQVLCGPDDVRCVTYCGKVSEEFQRKTIAQLQNVWSQIKEGTYIDMDKMNRVADFKMGDNPLMDIIRGVNYGMGRT